MYQSAAIGIGVMISLMVTANSGLQTLVGALPSLLVIHLSGIVLVAIILLARRSRFRGLAGTPPWYFMGGVVGIGLLFTNNLTIASLGVTLTVSLGILGQMLMSAVVDHLGLFGLERRPFSARKAAGMGIMAAGLAVMVLPWGA